VTKAPVLILGGRSDIGSAIAHRFATEGHPIQLAARRSDDLEMQKSDLELRYRIPVTLHEFDTLETAAHAAFVAGLPELPEVAICVVGLLGRQQEDERDLEAAIRVMRSNYEGPAAALSVLASAFEARGSGTIVGVSSVAGDRGRASNYIYGSAKAGFTAFLSGLRNRLAKKGVHVVTVKPGFVRTRMTEDMELPGRLTAEPSEVADAVYRAVVRGRDVVYVRPIWRIVMMVIRLIPEGIFKRMKI